MRGLASRSSGGVSPRDLVDPEGSGTGGLEAAELLCGPGTELPGVEMYAGRLGRTSVGRLELDVRGPDGVGAQRSDCPATGESRPLYCRELPAAVVPLRLDEGGGGGGGKEGGGGGAPAGGGGGKLEAGRRGVEDAEQARTSGVFDDDSTFGLADGGGGCRRSISASTASLHSLPSASSTTLTPVSALSIVRPILAPLPCATAVVVTAAPSCAWPARLLASYFSRVGLSGSKSRGMSSRYLIQQIPRFPPVCGSILRSSCSIRPKLRKWV